MCDLAIKRFRNHQKLIRQTVSDYRYRREYDMMDESEEAISNHDRSQDGKAPALSGLGGEAYEQPSPRRDHPQAVSTKAKNQRPIQ